MEVKMNGANHCWGSPKVAFIERWPSTIDRFTCVHTCRYICAVLYLSTWVEQVYFRDKYSDIVKDNKKTYNQIPKQQPLKEKLLPQVGLEPTTFSVLG